MKQLFFMFNLNIIYFTPLLTLSSPLLLVLSAAVRPHQSSDRHSKEHRSFLAAEIFQEWRCS